MKKLFGTLVSVAMSVTLSAHAMSDLTWERPILEAELNLIEGQPFSFPVAEKLTMNQRDGEEQPTSFTLVEDTGIRCVKAPCPSSQITEFKIVKVFELDPQTRIYEAYTEPTIEDVPQRKLEVTEFDGFQQQWNVLVYGPFGGSTQLVGYPR